LGHDLPAIRRATFRTAAARKRPARVCAPLSRALWRSHCRSAERNAARLCEPRPSARPRSAPGVAFASMPVNGIAEGVVVHCFAPAAAFATRPPADERPAVRVSEGNCVQLRDCFDPAKYEIETQPRVLLMPLLPSPRRHPSFTRTSNYWHYSCPSLVNQGRSSRSVTLRLDTSVIRVDCRPSTSCHALARSQHFAATKEQMVPDIAWPLGTAQSCASGPSYASPPTSLRAAQIRTYGAQEA
jgi:hypothetical protein